MVAVDYGARTSVIFVIGQGPEKINTSRVESAICITQLYLKTGLQRFPG